MKIAKNEMVASLTESEWSISGRAFVPVPDYTGKSGFDIIWAMIRSIFILCLGLAGSISSWAFRFSPMESEIIADGKRKSIVFVAENNSTKQEAIKISVFSRNVDLDGKETHSPTKDFLIYPPQMILKPGEKRNIRATLVNPEPVKIERAYRVVGEELPVRLERVAESTGSRLDFLIRFVASLYVSPQKGRSEVVVEKVEVVADRILLTLQNRGGIHKILTGLKVTFYSKGPPEESYVLPQEEAKVFEVDNILAGQSRRYTFVKPKTIAGELIGARIESP